MQKTEMITMRDNLLVELQAKLLTALCGFFQCSQEEVTLVEGDNTDASQLPEGRLDAIYVMIYLGIRQVTFNVVIDEVDYTLDWDFPDSEEDFDPAVLTAALAEVIFTQYNFRGRTSEEIAAEISEEINDGLVDFDNGLTEDFIADIMLDVFDIDVEMNHTDNASVSTTKH